ncbi:MAG TPA: hypothetical protein VJV78_28085 [Polyangiales bacterium]|nr:hypothetical protein [Polyangiales bacterium]
MHATRWVLIAALAGSTSCGHSTASRPAPAAAAPQPQPTPARAPLPLPKPEVPPSIALGDVMADHFLITSWARDAVIAGSLDALREPLTALADYRYEGLHPGGWLPWLAQLQAAARLTSDAATLDSAAVGVATMARVCGECHVANHGGPSVPEPAPEPEEQFAADTVPERMGRHMWAAEMLWEGLTAPSDVSWKAGVEALAHAPAQLDAELPASFDEQLNEVKAIGRDAGEATSLAQRADVYGLLIATCADCHSRWLDHGP